jgi:hypothetical protein
MNKAMWFHKLKQIFSDHFVMKHFTRHFRRLVILEMFRGLQGFCWDTSF